MSRSEKTCSEERDAISGRLGMKGPKGEVCCWNLKKVAVRKPGSKKNENKKTNRKNYARVEIRSELAANKQGGEIARPYGSARGALVRQWQGRREARGAKK